MSAINLNRNYNIKLLVAKIKRSVLDAVAKEDDIDLHNIELK